MKISLISGIFPPDIGGPATYIPWLAEELQALGHCVQVICLADRPGANIPYPYPITRLPRQLPLPLRIPNTARHITRLCRDSDLLYVNGLALEAGLAARRLGKPTLFKVVSDWAWERACYRRLWHAGLEEFQKRKGGARIRCLKKIRNLFLGQAARIIVPCGYLAALLQQWGIEAEKIRVVFNSISLPPLPPVPQLSLPRPSLITACRLIREKGLDALLRALQKVPGPSLLIAGDGEEAAFLKKLSAELGLGERVRFLGRLPREEFLAHLSQADVALLTSRHEGLPHVLLEAMALGKPVVATRVGGVPELVEEGKNGLLVTYGRQEQLETALRRISRDEGLRRALAAGASLTNRRFSPRRTLLETVRIMEEVAP